MRIVIMAGTRPEVVKMAPVIRRLRQEPRMDVVFCATGQHREMLAQACVDFGLAPDVNLDVMSAGQGLGQLSARLFQAFDNYLEQAAPDWLLVQGDTTSVMAAAMCAFYRKIKIGHVEAGLRSFNRHEPFPEEINRKVVALVADAHFAPTDGARANLLAEGIAPGSIELTGNTVVDALRYMLEKIRAEGGRLPPGAREQCQAGRKLILVTAHRRENHGEPLARICRAIGRLADKRRDIAFVYPVHYNPAVRETAWPLLGGRENILLLDPLPYRQTLALLDAASLALTDSGGLQEEAAVLRKPALVLRERTERMEGVDAGAALLVGSDMEAIAGNVEDILDNPARAEAMAAAGGNLYGDGRAAERIVAYLRKEANCEIFSKKICKQSG